MLDLGQGLGIKTLEKWRKGDYLGDRNFLRALEPSVPHGEGLIRKKAGLVEVWENGELDLGWEPSIFSLESPGRRLN